jgi:hypothetical protein
MIYNRARGKKELVVYRGGHSILGTNNPNFGYVVSKLLNFAQTAALRPSSASLNNNSQTTVRSAVCGAPDTESGHGVLFAKEITNENELEQFIKHMLENDNE